MTNVQMIVLSTGMTKSSVHVNVWMAKKKKWKMMVHVIVSAHAKMVQRM